MIAARHGDSRTSDYTDADDETPYLKKTGPCINMAPPLHSKLRLLIAQ